MQLKFHGFYMQATLGPCLLEKPSIWDPKARAQHEAWSKLDQMSENEAMIGYINTLKQVSGSKVKK